MVAPETSKEQTTQLEYPSFPDKSDQVRLKPDWNMEPESVTAFLR